MRAPANGQPGHEPGFPHPDTGGRLPMANAGTAWAGLSAGFVASFRPSQGGLRFAIWRQVEKMTTKTCVIHHHQQTPNPGLLVPSLALRLSQNLHWRTTLDETRRGERAREMTARGLPRHVARRTHDASRRTHDANRKRPEQPPKDGEDGRFGHGFSGRSSSHEGRAGMWTR